MGSPTPSIRCRGQRRQEESVRAPGGRVVGSRQRPRPGWGPALQHLLTEGLGGAWWVTGTRGNPGTPRVSSNVCCDVGIERAQLSSQQSVCE